MHMASPTSTPPRSRTCSSRKATSPRRTDSGRWTSIAATPTASLPKSWGRLCSVTTRRSACYEFRNTAHRVYANLPAEERARYEAYARGVNLFITQHQDSLPPEFRFLHYKPQPWTGADSISIGMMMVDMLDTHWYTKLSRERIAAKLHNPKLESDLYPVGSWRDHPPYRRATRPEQAASPAARHPRRRGQ